LFTCLDRVSLSIASEGKLHIVSQVKLLVVKFGMHVNEITGYSMKAKLLYILLYMLKKKIVTSQKTTFFTDDITNSKYLLTVVQILT
jgi:hypothetical protein